MIAFIVTLLLQEEDEGSGSNGLSNYYGGCIIKRECCGFGPQDNEGTQTEVGQIKFNSFYTTAYNFYNFCKMHIS